MKSRKQTSSLTDTCHDYGITMETRIFVIAHKRKLGLKRHDPGTKREGIVPEMHKERSPGTKCGKNVPGKAKISVWA